MELPEPRAKTYTIKLDPDATFRIENLAHHLQLRPSDLLKDIIADWLSKR